MLYVYRARPARPVECETYSSGVGQMIVLGWNAFNYSTGALCSLRPASYLLFRNPARSAVASIKVVMRRCCSNDILFKVLEVLHISVHHVYPML